MSKNPKGRVIWTSKLSTVYKARLEDGQTVAIKKLNLLQFAAQSDKCFNREATILSQLRHWNLVKVIGYAWESGRLKALVLKYMENRNSDSIIHDPSVDQFMWTLLKRISILVSVAYSHSEYDFAMVHCDLKPSNILLDEDWEAHVSDFGTARMLGVHDIQGGTSSSSSSAAFEGTIGYMHQVLLVSNCLFTLFLIYQFAIADFCPFLRAEYAYMRSAKTKVDIFSFGVVVMELMTRRRPTGLVGEDGLPVTLRNFVSASVSDDNKLLGIIDPSLASSVTEEQVDVLKQVLNLALFCTSPDPEDRLTLMLCCLHLSS